MLVLWFFEEVREFNYIVRSNVPLVRTRVNSNPIRAPSNSRFRCFYDVKQGLVFSQCVVAKGHDPPTHNIPDVVESGHRADNDNVHCDLIDMSNVWHLSVKKMKANGQLFGACNSIVAFSAFDGIGIRCKMASR